MIDLLNTLSRFENLKELANKNGGYIEPTLYVSEIESIIKALEKQSSTDVKKVEDKAKRSLFLDILNYVNDKRIENKQVTVNEVIEYIAKKEKILYALVE